MSVIQAWLPLGFLRDLREAVKHHMEVLHPDSPQEVLGTWFGILRVETFFPHHTLSC